MDRIVQFEVKAVDLAKKAKGYFEALVAVYGNVDEYGDRLIKGSLAESLTDWGYPSCVTAHQWSVPPIGATEKAEELDEGLLLGVQMFVDEGIDLVDHIYLAMSKKNGDGKSPLRQFSIGYDVKKYSVIEDKSPEAAPFGGKVRQLEVITCYEAGPCLVGVNQATELLGIKALTPQIPQAAQTGPSSEAKSEAVPDRDRADLYLTALNGRR